MKALPMLSSDTSQLPLTPKSYDHVRSVPSKRNTVLVSRTHQIRLTGALTGYVTFIPAEGMDSS